MPDDDAIKRLEARLARLEASTSQATGAAAAQLQLGPITDPGPYGPPYYGGGWGGWRPFPIVDPAVSPYFRPIVDPGPYGPPYYGGGYRGGVLGGFGPGVDPATYANSILARVGPVGPIGDPPPPDVSRFSVAQLEGALHSINAEKARLASLETLVSKQLERAKAQQG
jgi:hypothetical protein